MGGEELAGKDLESLAGAGELGAEGEQAGATGRVGLGGESREALGQDPLRPGGELRGQVGGCAEFEAPGFTFGGELGVAGEGVELAAHEVDGDLDGEGVEHGEQLRAQR